MIGRKFILLFLCLAVAACANVGAQTPEEKGPDLQALVETVQAKYAPVKEGANANYIPILDTVDPELFGVVIVTVDGKVYSAGAVDHSFSIQSVSKPFTMALVVEEQGLETIVDKVGVEPTGLPFNSIHAIELNPERAVNPLVNAGAIATVSLIEADSAEARWDWIIKGFNAFAGEELTVIDEVYTSEAATNDRNQAIAKLLKAYVRLYCDPLEATDVYTKQCSIGVTCKQMAMMGATLANGGVNPKTKKKLIRKEYVDEVLAVMMMAGFYDEVGIWAFKAGLPAKTGVGGGIVAIVPGRMAIGAFSPRLNPAGNSVRSLKAIEHISKELGLSVFLAPEDRR
ncbi:MAG: glutaminase A [Planctomycetota bacterium]